MPNLFNSYLDDVFNLLVNYYGWILDGNLETMKRPILINNQISIWIFEIDIISGWNCQFKCDILHE